MPLDKSAPISLELESLTIVLTNEVGDPCFSISHTGSQLRCQSPFELLWGCLDVLFGLVGWLAAV